VGKKDRESAQSVTSDTKRSGSSRGGGKGRVVAGGDPARGGGRIKALATRTGGVKVRAQLGQRPGFLPPGGLNLLRSKKKGQKGAALPRWFLSYAARKEKGRRKNANLDPETTVEMETLGKKKKRTLSG